jgi:hypothetical protein
LGYRSSSTVLVGDFFVGAYGTDGTDATAIQADFGISWAPGESTSAAGVYSTNATGDTALVTYLNAQYTAGAQAGDYVFLRFNPDTVQSTNNYWTIASGDSATPPVLTITTGGGTPSNAAPTVDAGTNQTITLPADANLDGTVSDDGLPDPPDAVTVTWSKISGAGTVTFGNASAVDTTAAFSADDTYVLQLEADDSEMTASDTVTITVNPVPNVAPTVDAGADSAIIEGGVATLDGTVSDDGLPNPPATVTTTWTQQSGPGTATFANASAIDTTATFSANGTYVLQLQADDSALTAADTVTVTVSPATVYTIDGDGADAEIWEDMTMRWIPETYIRVGELPTRTWTSTT